MTFTCKDPACECVAHQADPFDHGKIPVCPHCRRPLRDVLGQLVTNGAGWGYCPGPHYAHGVASISIHYLKQSWDWRPVADFASADLMPAGEVAEMAANAEPAEMDLEESR